VEQRGDALKRANALDLETGRQMGLSAAMLDRLQLDDKRIAGMAKGLREVAALPDPVGRILDERTRPNGLKLQKVSVPIGVVVIIYESRPNVTADAASLCFKSGNATILRGGKEALNSNRIIAETMVAAARRRLPNFPEHAIQVVPTTDRDAIKELLALTQYVDLCMPRGGEGLIRAVAECSKVPVIKHYKGVCHVYVDGDADLKMAEGIVINAKTQRPGVCNTMETLLVDRSIAAMFLPTMAQKLLERNVELRAAPAALSLLQSPIANRQSPTTVPGLPIDNGQPPTTDPESPTANRQARIKAATEQDWDTEFLDLIMGVRVVDGVAGAVAHINQH
ncbi:MAG: glutamate-5-semialdehyde dehydrogenase, partial [Pedosphaera parvula]|nr:glutamate-5-semialdehyde dehydrogenase [Pedosphaera parvula]